MDNLLLLPPSSIQKYLTLYVKVCPITEKLWYNRCSHIEVSATWTVSMGLGNLCLFKYLAFPHLGIENTRAMAEVEMLWEFRKDAVIQLVQVVRRDFQKDFLTGHGDKDWWTDKKRKEFLVEGKSPQRLKVQSTENWGPFSILMYLIQILFGRVSGNV